MQNLKAYDTVKILEPQQVAKVDANGKPVIGPDGKPMKMKMVTKTIDDDHETFEMYMIGPDGKEMKGMTIEYTRRKR